MASRDERLAENQREFRFANERLQELVESAGAADHRVIAFLCECADDSCFGRVELTTEQYGEIHEDESRFVILPRHPRMPGEEIVGGSDFFEIVVKQDS